MNFPDVTAWIQGLTALAQLIGAGFFVTAFCMVGLIFMTSFGNERKSLLAKTAAGSALLGLFFVLAAPAISNIIKQLAGLK